MAGGGVGGGGGRDDDDDEINGSRGSHRPHSFDIGSSPGRGMRRVPFHALHKDSRSTFDSSDKSDLPKLNGIDNRERCGERR